MLNNLKVMLNLQEDETDLDEKLELIIESVNSRLKVLLGEEEIPAELKYIVLEVAVIRYNRIGSEGMTINNVEGENQHFNTNDFLPYDAEIQAYRESKESGSKKGGFRIL